MYQIITFYTQNLCDIIYQLYLNKVAAGGGVGKKAVRGDQLQKLLNKSLSS